MADGERIRVAIVGGGCAGMTAAWCLAKDPKYEVHVYEKSWRLGGKGASVRDAEGRILEHGLHVWLGFYENAFRMMRECYAEVEKREWGPESKDNKLVYGRIAEAFLPEPHIGVGRRDVAGNWQAWSASFPPALGLPGEPLDERTNPFTLANYLQRCFGLLKTLMLSVIGAPEDDVPGDPRPDKRSTFDEAMDWDLSVNSADAMKLLIERSAVLLRGGALVGAAVLLQAVTILEVWLRQLDFAPQVADSALQLAEAVTSQTRKMLHDVVAIDDNIRTRTEAIDILLTIAVGLFRDRVLFDPDGLDSINDLDYRAWLLHHGATKGAVESKFITGAYDLVFAYLGGDRGKPQLAAGVALRGALRMFFTYRGSMFWRIRAGMGDTVFAPLYRVLQLSGRSLPQPGDPLATASPVQFHFLHDLAAVEIKVDDGRRYLSSLTFRTRGDATLLKKLSADALDDFGCWPDSPEARFGDAIEGGHYTETLEADDDFDCVIIATGVDHVKELFESAIKRRVLPPQWARMCADVATVATQAAQVWLKDDLEGLGWYRGSGLFTALGLSIETWADMTHTLAAERARRGGKPNRFDDARSVAYFCAALPQSEVRRLGGDAALLKARIGKDLDRMLDADLRAVWPTAFENGARARALEIDRHIEANFEGSDRYTQSLPASIRSRISPLDRSIENMTIAGDWTACGLDVGGVESAVMSGMLAAYAVSGSPDPRSIIGFDHP